MGRNQAFAAAATIAVTLGIAGGFYFAGSPEAQREGNADAARSRDLSSISDAVTRFRRLEGSLPDSFAELEITNPGLRFADPETGELYEYRKLEDSQRFELCAVFSTDTQNVAERPANARPHASGRVCFVYS